MTDPSLRRLLDQAEEHGKEGDPEHEVGDLQDMLTACWKFLAMAEKHSVVLQFTEDEDDS